MSRNLPLESCFKWILRFFDVESIRGFTSTFLDICSATLYPFLLPSRSKCTPLEVLKVSITALSNQDKKVAFIRVDEDGALVIYCEFMKIFHNMNITVQNIGVDSSYLNIKSESTNKTLANITRALLLNSSHKR